MGLDRPVGLLSPMFFYFTPVPAELYTPGGEGCTMVEDIMMMKNGVHARER